MVIFTSIHHFTIVTLLPDLICGKCELAKNVRINMSTKLQASRDRLRATYDEFNQSFKRLDTVDEQAHSVEAIGFSGTNFLPSSDVLTEKIRQTKAEIDVVKNSPISTLPESPILQFDVVKCDLEKGLAELHDTLLFIKADAQELEREIVDEEQLGVQLGDIVIESLNKRLSDQIFEKDDVEGAKEKLKSEIEEKRIKATAYFKQLLRDSSDFCKKYFKLPSEEEFSEIQKKLRSADKTATTRNMLSLKDIISELMNKCFDEPNQPYIVLDTRYWPPYIELLLRCQIALRHPDDPRRIKLIPFHL